MSNGVERCPHCDVALAARTNGMGHCYLECSNLCGYGETIERRDDPFPTKYVMRKIRGKEEILPLVPQRSMSTPYRHGILGSRKVAGATRVCETKRQTKWPQRKKTA